MGKRIAAGNRHESATAALAAFASGLAFDDIPKDVVEKAKLCLLDTVGCCIYGSTLSFMKTLTNVVLAEGGAAVATILGTPHRTSASQAALVNGTAAHAFQLDEVHAGATLHPGSIVVPAVLALSEATGALPGRDFVAAMIAGYEVGIRIGLAADGGMFRRGYHNQGTTGTLAAAAAAARALGLDSPATAQALGIAASQSAGLMAVQEGANAKAFHSGRAAQSGVYAALLARNGFTGAEDVLDVDYGGFFSTLVDRFKSERLTAGLGKEWETRKVGYKLSPASNGSITAMDTLSRIMQSNGLTAGDIERISAFVSTNTLHHCGWEFDPSAVKGVLGAQMNLRYGLAAMALDGVATPAQYTEARIRDPKLAGFLGKVDVRACDEFDNDSALRLACRLEVRSRDGQTYVDQTLYRKGSAEDPVSAAQLEDKFLTLTAAVLTDRPARACIEQIRTMDSVPRVSRLGSMQGYAE